MISLSKSADKQSASTKSETTKNDNSILIYTKFDQPAPLRRGLPLKEPRKLSGPRTQAMWIIRDFLLIRACPRSRVACASAGGSGGQPPPDGGYPNFNTAEGTDALFSLTTGANNTAIGSLALRNNTSGSANTANGSGALASNTNGVNNTANGFQALLFNINGHENTAYGVNALVSNTSSLNTANGFQALQSNTNGHENTANRG